MISRNCCNEQYLSICFFIYLIFVLSVFLLAILFYYPSIFCVVNKFYFKYHFIFEKSLCFFSSVWLDYEQSLFFSWSVQQNSRDTQMTTRVTVCEEKEKLLAVYCLVYLGLIERFSYDLEIKTREQYRNNKQTEIERFDWFIEHIQTRVAFGWLSEHSGEKTSCLRTF